ncbi:MAG: tetratricopeptide repeat protein [Ignavibacteria bacterium]|nr:tetratricopeptide repeat protein [Ignavibacteria bacterium]
MGNINITDSDREVRVFVSSTFKDMMKERDYLIKEVFPEIRHRCHQRGIEFTEIDLRWGVTEKQAQHGKVIEVCLKEIDRCRPFFIGILGERYGWIPHAEEYIKHKKFLEEFPWIRKDIDKGLSITEMEIQYGVLRNTSLSKNALFYLRKPQSSLTSSKETPVSEDGTKLIELKKTLQSQNKFPVKQFSKSDELGNLILEDLWELIEKSFPDLVTPDPIEQERLDHTTFLKSRLRVYIGGQKYLNRLNVHANNEDTPLVITGESGLGKSALLANWITHYQKKHPDTYILYHFIGGVPDSTDYTQIVRRILEELKLKFSIKDTIPDNPKEMSEAFSNFLAQTGRAGKWILILDALNYLDNINNARLLNWLPEYFPPYVRVIFSTLHGETENILRKRGYGVLNIKPLSISERKALITQYLNQYSKSLPAKTVTLIALNKGFSSPLLLRTFLDEIRIFGLYEKLEKRISYYVKSTNPVEFFKAVLIRIEEDYEKERKDLIKELLSLLWTSRKGLTEKELLDISGVPPLYWSALNNSFENHLIRRNGLLNFLHDHIKQAIEKYFLKTEKTKTEIHLKLAKFFSKNPLSERCLEELPYHLKQTKQWNKLKNYLSDIDVFLRIYETDEYDLVNYWRSLDEHFDMGKVYTNSIKKYFANKNVKPELKTKIYDTVGRFLNQNAHYKEAEKMLENALRVREKTFGRNHAETADSLYNLAYLYRNRNKYEKAEQLYKRSLKIRENIYGKEHIETIKTLNSLVWLYVEQGKFSIAEPLAQLSLKLCEKALGTQHLETAFSLNSLALVYMYIGKHKESESLFKRALSIREKILGAEHPLTANSYVNFGVYYQRQGYFKKAELLFERALIIIETIFGPHHPKTIKCIENLAGNHYCQNQFTEAESLYNRIITTSIKIHGPENPIAAHSLNNLAALYDAEGKYSKAEQLLKRALTIREKISGKNHPNTLECLDNLAYNYYNQYKFKEAEKLFKRVITAREKIIGIEHPDTATSLSNLANLLRDQNRLEEAEPLFKQSLKIFKKQFGNNHPNTAIIQNNFAKLYSEQRKYQKAETLFTQALKTTIKVIGSGDLNVAKILNNIALVYIYQCKYKEAEESLNKSLSIRKSKLGEGHVDTADTFAAFGNLLEAKDEYKKALVYYKKASKIYEVNLGLKNKETQKMKKNIKSVTIKIKGNVL